jgi:hypothetical protein
MALPVCLPAFIPKALDKLLVAAKTENFIYIAEKTTNK